MTDDLTTALRDLAESDPPRAMDVEKVLHQGQRSLVRRRMGALGGGTAVLAVTGLAVGTLAPAGGAGHRGSATATSPATSVTSEAPAPTTPTVMPTRAAAVNPHDPATTYYQFGYLPDGMHAYGGGNIAAPATGQLDGSVTAYGSSAFELQIDAGIDYDAVKGSPIEKIPAHVPTAAKAFWVGDGNGAIVKNRPGFGDSAELAWQLPGTDGHPGQWLQVIAVNVHARPDWKEQTLKAAANVVRQDRSVPMPIKIAGGIPKNLNYMSATVMRDNGNTFATLAFDPGDLAGVQIYAYKPGSTTLAGIGVQPSATSTCADSNGLTLCVVYQAPEPGPLKAAGGATALLQKVTSLGNDPANWTTDVYQ
jgi:hypothetical protein